LPFVETRRTLLSGRKLRRDFAASKEDAMHGSKTAAIRAITLLTVAGALVPDAAVAQQFGARIGGTVRDSLAGRPLAGARVELIPAAARESPGYSTESDASGGFRLDSVAPGRYVLGFAHPRLDSLGLVLTPRLVEVGAASTVRADLAVPSARALGQVLCGIQSAETGALVGRVMDADTGVPVETGTVLIRWGEIQADSTGVQRVLRGVRARVGSGGRFAACGVPAGVAVLVQARALTSQPGGVITAASDADSIGKASIAEVASDGIEITLDPADPVRFRDIFVPSTSLRPAAARDSLTRDGLAAERAVASRVTGRVLQPDGKPLVGARVRARSGQPNARETVTNADGYFILDAVPSGTQTIEVIAIGYMPSRSAVDLRPTAATTFDIRLQRTVDVLTPVSVYSAPARASSEFAIRQRRGFGAFLTADDITRRTSTYLANALAGVGGLRIIGTNSIGAPVLGGRSNCVPAVVLDGFRVPEGIDGVERWIRPADIGGIEVYPDGINAPPQYSGQSAPDGRWFTDRGSVNLVRQAPTSAGASSCGLLLVWTKQALW
jgi:Carboxypeptidase regulatory-like domain